MSVYREPGEQEPLPPKPRHKGMREKCPSCTRGMHVTRNYDPDVRGVTNALFCGPASRCPVGIFRRCKVPGAHLHQSCTACGASWLCDTAEAM